MVDKKRPALCALTLKFLKREPMSKFASWKVKQPNPLTKGLPKIPYKKRKKSYYVAKWLKVHEKFKIRESEYEAI